MYRLRERLCHRLQLLVKEGARKIGAGLDVGRVSAAAERNRHLLRRLDQGITDNFKLDRIKCRFHNFS